MMLQHISRHKTFTSYHHQRDQKYADLLRSAGAVEIIDKSVNDGDINDGLGTDAIWRTIRDDFIADATVTIVLIGRDTWRRKFVDWEIGSSLSKTKNNSRCGVLGILLPDHPDYGKRYVDPKSIPPRLAKNITGYNPYVRLYNWPGDNNLSVVADWVEIAFQRRNGPPPNNYSKRFKRNRPVARRPAVQDTFSSKDLLIGGGIALGTIAALLWLRNRRQRQESPRIRSIREIAPRSRRRALRSRRIVR